MGGVLDLVRGRNDAYAAQAFATAEEPQTQQTGKEEANYSHDPTPSDSDTLSLEARNEKEVQAHPDQITSYVDLGIKKAEAAALVWSRKAVYATYAWYVLTSWKFYNERRGLFSEPGYGSASSCWPFNSQSGPT